MLKQQRLTKKPPFYGTTYDRPQYNKVVGLVQRVELHRGCPWGHGYCYEPDINEDFPIPEIVRNQVQILDMNPLARKDILEVIKALGEIRVDGKVVHYEFVCGIDFRLLTQEIANAMKESRFVRPRLAWDGPFSEQMKLKDALYMLLRAGYQQDRDKIMMFMIVNWEIPFEECMRKLDLMKIWNVLVCDCCYDGGYKVAVPVYWSEDEIDRIRRICRRHNLMVLFKIDPEENRHAGH